MADDARHATADLMAGATPRDVSFFELLRQLEADGLRFGRAGGPEREPARLGQGARLAFATCDVARITSGRDHPPFVQVQVLGLLGPEGPLPLHLTRWVMSRISNRWFAGGEEGATADTAFLDFCNLLQHRAMALYWRAWADAHVEVGVPHGSGGRAVAIAGALAGTGLPGTATGGPVRRAAKLRHGTDLAARVHSPERLTRYLSDVIGAPLRLVEFVGVWTTIPTRLQSRLGCVYYALGGSMVLGARVFERQSRAELQVGPLGLDAFLRLAEDPETRSELRHALLFAAGHETEWDVRLVLAGDEVPELRLGRCRLGKTTWLPRAIAADAGDLRLGQFVGRPEPERAAA